MTIHKTRRGEKIIVKGATYRLIPDSRSIAGKKRMGYSIYRATREHLRLVGFVWRDLGYLEWNASSTYGKQYEKTTYTRQFAIAEELKHG